MALRVEVYVVIVLLMLLIVSLLRELAVADDILELPFV